MSWFCSDCVSFLNLSSLCCQGFMEAILHPREKLCNLFFSFNNIFDITILSCTLCQAKSVQSPWTLWAWHSNLTGLNHIHSKNQSVSKSITVVHAWDLEAVGCLQQHQHHSLSIWKIAKSIDSAASKQLVNLDQTVLCVKQLLLTLLFGVSADREVQRTFGHQYSLTAPSP